MNQQTASALARNWIFALLAIWASSGTAWAQFSLNGQILVRSEFRHGYSQPLPDTAEPAGFIAHRARLEASYQMKHVRMFMSIQDVRTWGSVSQANLTDPFLSVHEAYGEILFNDFWSLKLGRQELNYDNARFLGNLDWALQGRSHDFALLKFEKNAFKLHAGGGFNQEGQATSGNSFNVPNQYRTAQMMHAQNTWGALEVALLFWNEGRTGVDTSTKYQQTAGIPTLRYTLGNTQLSGFAYYQWGRDVEGKRISAFNVNGQASQTIPVNQTKGSSFHLTVGAEIISGSASNQSTNTAYSLQYGTNHAHNGYMDWYFVGSNWQNSFGLTDVYFRSRYTHREGMWLQADLHAFSAQATPEDGLGNPLSKNLGTELDLVAGYQLNESISFQGGYSQFFTSSTPQALQGVPLSELQNWAYVMVIFRPGNPQKFIGVLQ